MKLYQLTAGGEPSLLGPPLEGGSALFRSFRRRSDAGRITYNITANIISSIIMKKLPLAPWFGASGKSMHSLSVQYDWPLRSSDNNRRIAISWLQMHSHPSNSSLILLTTRQGQNYREGRLICCIECTQMFTPNRTKECEVKTFFVRLIFLLLLPVATAL